MTGINIGMTEWKYTVKLSGNGGIDRKYEGKKAEVTTVAR